MPVYMYYALRLQKVTKTLARVYFGEGHVHRRVSQPGNRTGDQRAARDLFLKTATQVFHK